MLHPKNTEIYFTLNTGAKMPALGLGTANEIEQIPETKQAVKAAIKSGYRLIDTAWAYRCEDRVGEALKELFEEGAIKREDIFITTKVWPTHWDIASDSISRSLENLGVEYVDLVLQHWPLCFNRVEDKDGVDGIARNPTHLDGSANINEEGDYLSTYKQLEKMYLAKDPRFKAIGVSNYPLDYLQRLLKECRVVPAVNQVEIHPQLPQMELRDFCTEHGIRLESYSPFGATGSPLTKNALMQKLAEKYSCTPNDILLAYNIRQGVVTVPRSVNPKNIVANIEFISLTKEDSSVLNKYGLENSQRFRNEKFAESIPGFREN
ncbi:LAME_0F06854g1_1 [Lachancea meyersii CBS 8951]|uniref:LAME_0F06854g1_1 n=1 Tax=Lachancea meyersii CBS 8951 TaxID=1266667 RepID=A0A1G4JTP8_9SACH|nr:LAME_0F06854g1_1 [Lachancea meyersii CBS 8951]